MRKDVKQYSVTDILGYLGKDYKIAGDIEEKFFNNVKPIWEAQKDTLVWVNPGYNDKQAIVEETSAQIIICDYSIKLTDKIRQNKCLLITENPKIAFIKIIDAFFQKKVAFGIHPTASIHKEAKIHPQTFIGPFSYIGKCIIEENSIIYGNCYLYDNVKIGKNVIIHAGCIIGADGFGYAKDETQELHKFVHLGGIIIENNVEIGANTCIDRGTLGYTWIKEGTKIDNLVHIAHNVVIGKHSVIIAHTMIGGSTIIGDYSWIAPAAILRDGITIGNNTTIGMGSLVTKDVPDGEVWLGVPAIKKM